MRGWPNVPQPFRRGDTDRLRVRLEPPSPRSLKGDNKGEGTVMPSPHIMSSTDTIKYGRKLALVIDPSLRCAFVSLAERGRWAIVTSKTAGEIDRHRTAVHAWNGAFFRLIRCKVCQGGDEGCHACQGHGQRRLTAAEAAAVNRIIPNLYKGPTA